MEKRIYSNPRTEVMNLSSELMQHLSSQSSVQFPGGPGGAPKRRDSVF